MLGTTCWHSWKLSTKNGFLRSISGIQRILGILGICDVIIQQNGERVSTTRAEQQRKMSQAAEGLHFYGYRPMA